MQNKKFVNFDKVKECINSEARKVSRENIDGIKSDDEKYFLRAWCLRRCDWCDCEIDVKDCYFSTDDNVQ